MSTCILEIVFIFVVLGRIFSVKMKNINSILISGINFNTFCFVQWI